MKFSYTFLKRLLAKTPKKERIVDALNMHSFEAENLEGDIIEVSLPPNRYSDAASHLGLAREIAAVMGLKTKSPVKTLVNFPQDKGFLEVKIENPKLCPRYSARYFEIPKVAESPAWMQAILKSCGLKPINHIVDLMNYVMLETGQPLHAFDFDTLAKVGKSKRGVSPRKIVVRRARKGEKIHTLDGQRVTLDPRMLVIADNERPLAIAGIKGGEDSGVHAKTKRIIVEAANFDPASIYETSRKLKLVTDAAARFSHGISASLVDVGLDRATMFLTQSKAWLLDSVDVYPRKESAEIVEFSIAQYEKLVGDKIDEKTLRKYFALLGFEIEPNRVRNGAFLVRIPLVRTDIENFEDVAEEVGRLRGYGGLKAKPPFMAVKAPHEEDSFIFKDRVRKFFTSFGVDEIYNSSFLGKTDIHENDVRVLFERGAKLVEVENPIAADKRFLRPSLLPLLTKSALENGRFYDAVRIFEIGKTFARLGKKEVEKLGLGIVLAGKKDKRLILELKGLLDDFFMAMGLADFIFEEEGGALRVKSGMHVLAALDSFSFEKGWYAAVAEVDAERLLALLEAEREFKPLPKFPAVVRDISLLLEREVRIGDVVEEIQDANPGMIEDVDLIDEYRDAKLGTKQSITFRIVFQREDRTLTDAEVNAEMEKINGILKGKYNAGIR